MAYTLEELRTAPIDVLTPAEVAPILRADAQYIRVTARKNPEALGFPVIVIGKRVKIPRIPFLQYMEGGSSNG